MNVEGVPLVERAVPGASLAVIMLHLFFHLGSRWFSMSCPIRNFGDEGVSSIASGDSFGECFILIAKSICA